MSSATPPVVPTDSRRVVIESLEKLQDAEQKGQKGNSAEKADLSTLSMIIHEEQRLTELWKQIEEHGFQKPLKLMIGEIEYYEDDFTYVVSDHEEVIVVQDDQISTKNTIRLTEPLISHANAHHGQAVDFNIAPLPSSKRAVEANCGFQVSFERTPRMPDDNRLHQLPGSVGSYDLFSVDAYADRLPINIREDGGVFFPMWQREAMWLNFETRRLKCAVRVFMGHVNAVSGLTMEETASSEDDSKKQDYIVIPGQRWLDGICVAPGVVRQFVAMPLGSGYTVEGQKTSKEQHGGLQLEITPECLPDQRLWSHAKDNCVSRGKFTRGLVETMTPQQLGCKIGDILRSYPADFAYEEPLKMKHLAKPGTDITCTVVSTRMYLSGNVRRFKSSSSFGNSGTRQQEHSHDPSGYDYFSRSDEIFGLPLLSSVEKSSEPSIVAYSEKCAEPPSQEPDTIQSHSSIWKALESRADFRACGSDGDESLELCADDVEAVDSVELEVTGAKDIKAMGLAAGGKLIQDIYKDPYPAAIWNHTAARLLHVHILDPASCEKVTHIVPRPPQMDSKAYTEAGGQFFVVEEKADERLDGGDFDNVKSLSQMDQHIGISTEPEFDPTKPKMCMTCELRLCDCIIRPCDHQFCNVCIKRIEQNSAEDPASAHRNWKCPTCDSVVSHVAGFSAPMNLPGEEPLRIKVPVNVLEIEDGRARFKSVQTTRI